MSDSLISHQYVENSPGLQEKNVESSSQEKDEYSVNPNQKVYDMPHQLDHEVNVVKIYFAEQKPKMKWENKEEPYTVQSVNGATAKAIKDKKEGDLKKLKKEIKNIQVLDSADDTKVLSDITKLKKAESVKIKWEENVRQKDAEGKPAFEYSQINKISIKKKVWVVANCEGTTGKLTIQINENKLENEDQIYENPIKFLIGQEEKDKIEFQIKGLITYSKEITLRPKSEDDLKKLIEKFDKRKDKNAFLYFKAEVTETQDEVKFPDDTHEFLNKDGERLEIDVVKLPPWVDIAIVEEAKIIRESTHCEYIKDTYHASTDNAHMKRCGSEKDATRANSAWCGSFVAYCLKTSGYKYQPDPGAIWHGKVSLVKRKDGAPYETTEKWGIKYTEMYIGGIVEWHNDGHTTIIVGIDKSNPQNYIVLGGNQTNGVRFWTAPKTKVHPYCIFPIDYKGELIPLEEVEPSDLSSNAIKYVEGETG
ncbi:hypothetical protein MQX03_18540 [Chryseobacterium aahli]|uniref:hypothetical protein n=1 Tax=Chryseobacterium aahli TaxID=1278643 RepID=UPI001F623E40|nr:hypothetical protein [Chryseobacterium aahli]MCI3939176.1 hypothetical protein [Chryseobacterium aahli]